MPGRYALNSSLAPTKLGGRKFGKHFSEKRMNPSHNKNASFKIHQGVKSVMQNDVWCEVGGRGFTNEFTMFRLCKSCWTISCLCSAKLHKATAKHDEILLRTCWCMVSHATTLVSSFVVCYFWSPEAHWSSTWNCPLNHCNQKQVTCKRIWFFLEIHDFCVNSSKCSSLCSESTPFI